MKKIIIGVAIAGVVAVAMLKLLQFSKGMAVWGSERKQLETILGSGAKEWLDGAEIAAWAPDPNYKPQSYYITRDATAEETRRFATSFQIALTNEPSVPPGVWKLPEGIKLSRWTDSGSAPKDMLEGGGSAGKAMVSIRWSAGNACMVVTPRY